MPSRFKIKKGDNVVVCAGRDKGREGEVLHIFSEGRVLVRGIHMAKRHTAPSQASPEGGILAKETKIHISNLALKDPKTGKPTRVGIKFLEDGRKVRVARRSGEQFNA